VPLCSSRHDVRAAVFVGAELSCHHARLRMSILSGAPRLRTAFCRIARIAPLTCVAGLLFAVWHWGILPEQHRHFGDDQEYLTMTTSFVRHGSPDFQPGDDIATLLVLPWGWERSLGGKFFHGPAPASYFPDKDGRYYGYHFFTYSALVAPVRALLDQRFDRYRAHQYTNLLCFAAALLSLLQLRSRLFWSLTPLVFLTPVLWFLRYAHTEAFAFSFGVAALSCYLSGRVLLSILFSAIAATQYQPLALLPVFLYAEWSWALLRRAGGLPRKLPKLLLGLAITAIVLVPSVFYFVHFGTPNLIARQGFANTRLMSLSKFGWMFIDPNGGMVIYTPGVLLLLLAAAGWAAQRARRERDFWGLALFGCVLGTLFASTCQLNWNHPTFGVSRYVLYAVAPALLFIGSELAKLRLPTRLAVWRLRALVLTAVALQLFAHHEHGYFEYGGLDSAHHSHLAQYVLNHWPALYSPPAEIFCERTVSVCHTDSATGDPLPQYLPAIWRDPAGVPRKILATRCDAERVLSANPWSEAERAKIRAAMQSCRGTGVFYIDL
jgi:hypothetical protein